MAPRKPSQYCDSEGLMSRRSPRGEGCPHHDVSGTRKYQPAPLPGTDRGRSFQERLGTGSHRRGHQPKQCLSGRSRANAVLGVSDVHKIKGLQPTMLVERNMVVSVRRSMVLILKVSPFMPVMRGPGNAKLLALVPARTALTEMISLNVVHW
jgi:hypothetical protein